MKSTFKLSIICAALISITACSPQPSAVVVQPQQPVVQQPVVVQPAGPVDQYGVQHCYAPAPQVVVVHHDSGAALATGVLLGAAMSGGNRSDTTINHTTVVNKTVIVNNHAAPVAPVAVPAPVAPTFKPTAAAVTPTTKAPTIVANASPAPMSLSKPAFKPTAAYKK